jgi:hypothetical protein
VWRSAADGRNPMPRGPITASEQECIRLTASSERFDRTELLEAGPRMPAGNPMPSVGVIQAGLQDRHYAVYGGLAAALGLGGV